MDIGIQTSSASASFQVFHDMTQMLSIQHSIFGPNLDDLKEFTRLKKEISTASTQVGGLFAFISTTKLSVIEGELDLNSLAVDAPELLQITAGMIKLLTDNLKSKSDWIKAKPFGPSEVKKFNKECIALANILGKSSRELMELRQIVLSERGQAPSFRATRENLVNLAAAAARTDVEVNEFVEV